MENKLSIYKQQLAQTNQLTENMKGIIVEKDKTIEMLLGKLDKMSKQMKALRKELAMKPVSISLAIQEVQGPNRKLEVVVKSQ